MTHTGWLCCLRRKAGRSGPKEFDEDHSLCSKPNVNEEYLEAFRTKSYIEIRNKAQRQLGRTSTRRLSISSSGSTSSSLPFCMHLTEHLLEPGQEIIANLTESLKVHHLLVDYFKASFEACRYCDTILEGIHSIRLAHRRITRVFKLRKRVVVPVLDDQTQKDIYGELASFALQNNPFSITSLLQFRGIHDRYVALLHRLESETGKIRRRLTLKGMCKKVGGIALAVSHSAVLIALLVFAFHSIIGWVAAPAIMGGLVGLFSKRIKRTCEIRLRLGTSYSERLCEQLDVGAKGVYIAINDLDTTSRMVQRLHDELEHRKVVADVCVKNGKCEILKQVIKDFHDHECGFMDQLEELEEHIYLCFLNINRSRRLVMQQITGKSPIQ